MDVIILDELWLSLLSVSADGALMDLGSIASTEIASLAGQSPMPGTLVLGSWITYIICVLCVVICHTGCEQLYHRWSKQAVVSMAYKANISVISCTCEVAVNCCALCCLTMLGREEKPPSVPFLLPNTLPPDQSVPWAWGEWHDIQSLLKTCIFRPTTAFVPDIKVEYLDKMWNTYLFRSVI